MIKKIKHYFDKEIWQIELSSLPKAKAYLLKSLQILIVAFKGFNDDKVELRSSALTYYSLLSIVPIVAMAFGIAKGFGMDKKLNEILIEKLSAHEDVMHQVINFADSLLKNTQGGLIAGVGVILLFWSVLKVMGNIEDSFNAIWGISKGRNLIRKFTEYLSIMLIAPLLLILSSSLTVYITSKTKEVVNSVGVLEYVDQEISFLLSLSSYVVFWLLLTMIYMIMPNTKVKFKSALISGIVAGSIFVVVQWAYINFQVGVVKFNAIYGSFAALPLFLVWLRTSWLIVLFGAELSFVHQNIEKSILEEEADKISLSFRKKLSIYITHFVVQKFYKGEAPNINTIQNELKLPFRLVSNIIEELVSSKILSKSESSDYKVFQYQPAIDTSKLTISYILLAIENSGSIDIPIPNNPIFDSINNKIDGILENNKDIKIIDI